MHWLISKTSKLSLDCKALLYKSVLKPIWSYGIQIWGTTASSNVDKIQRLQSNILRNITGAPWFVRNSNIHRDLEVPMVQEEILSQCTRYSMRLRRHPNALATNLLHRSYFKRLKRKDAQDIGIT